MTLISCALMTVVSLSRRRRLPRRSRDTASDQSPANVIRHMTPGRGIQRLPGGPPPGCVAPPSNMSYSRLSRLARGPQRGCRVGAPVGRRAPGFMQRITLTGDQASVESERRAVDLQRTLCVERPRIEACRSTAAPPAMPARSAATAARRRRRTAVSADRRPAPVSSSRRASDRQPSPSAPAPSDPASSCA